jgi:hypothetical protein
MVSKALVDFVEEQRRVDPDSAAVEGPDGVTDDAQVDGYAPGQRSALDKLLDAQEKRQPSTAI